jgi:hypothetical protein
MTVNDHPTPRRRGAPPGNTNAFKHGYYAHVRRHRQVNTTEDLMQEIAFLRALVRRLYQQSRSEMTLPELLNVLRVLSLASGSLKRLLDTQQNLKITHPSYRQMLQEALDNAMNEMGSNETNSPTLS